VPRAFPGVSRLARSRPAGAERRPFSVPAALHEGGGTAHRRVAQVTGPAVRSRTRETPVLLPSGDSACRPPQRASSESKLLHMARSAHVGDNSRKPRSLASDSQGTQPRASSLGALSGPPVQAAHRDYVPPLSALRTDLPGSGVAEGPVSADPGNRASAWAQRSEQLHPRVWSCARSLATGIPAHRWGHHCSRRSRFSAILRAGCGRRRRRASPRCVRSRDRCGRRDRRWWCPAPPVPPAPARRSPAGRWR
jgi:hypothetical protein